MVSFPVTICENDCERFRTMMAERTPLALERNTIHEYNCLREFRFRSHGQSPRVLARGGAEPLRSWLAASVAGADGAAAARAGVHPLVHVGRSGAAR